MRSATEKISVALAYAPAACRVRNPTCVSYAAFVASSASSMAVCSRICGRLLMMRSSKRLRVIYDDVVSARDDY